MRARLTCEECPVLEDVPVDLSGGLRPGDEGHAELLPPQQLDVGLGHRPPHPAELQVRAGLGRDPRAGQGRGDVPSCPPGPSHHAILGGSALLHRVFKQHISLGVTETHPARPPQPVGTKGVSKDPPPLALPSLSTGHRSASRRVRGGGVPSDLGWEREG